MRPNLTRRISGYWIMIPGRARAFRPSGPSALRGLAGRTGLPGSAHGSEKPRATGGQKDTLGGRILLAYPVACQKRADPNDA